MLVQVYDLIKKKCISLTNKIYNRVLLASMLCRSYIKACLAPKDTFSIQGNSVKISYIRTGQEEHIYLPFRRMNRVKHTGHKAYLIKDDEMKDVSQCAGIPYFITAKDLGGSEIHLYYQDQILKFGPNDIPCFVEQE